MKRMEVTEKTSLKELVALAEQESEVVLTEHHKPVAKVLPISRSTDAQPGVPQPRKLGLHPGAWVVRDDFDEPLPDEFWLGQQ